MDSPFRPGFGKNPSFLVGRKLALEQLALGLEFGQWPQERGILMTGLRGVGKAVMLNQAEESRSERRMGSHFRDVLARIFRTSR